MKPEETKTTATVKTSSRPQRAESPVCVPLVSAQRGKFTTLPEVKNSDTNGFLPYIALAFGYGKGNRAGRRARLLWQQGKISGEQFATAAPEIARRTYGIIS